METNFSERLYQKAREIDESAGEIIDETKKMIESLPRKMTVERWTVYAFTLPHTTVRRVAVGFESREAARDFIENHLAHKKRAEPYENDGGHRCHTKYDVIRESREEIDVYYNDPTMTTVGNERVDVLERWLE